MKISLWKFLPSIVLSLMLLGSTSTLAKDGGSPFFKDVASAVGLNFDHWNGMTGALYFPEMTGVGGAVFDYDGDGDQDVYLVQGAPLAPGRSPQKTIFPYPGKGAPKDRLFRNDTKAGGELRFTDVTEASGLEATGYGMGVAVGDVDGDGFQDLYVTNYGPDQLWRNRGDGTFEDITESASRRI